MEFVAGSEAPYLNAVFVSETVLYRNWGSSVSRIEGHEGFLQVEVGASCATVLTPSV